jgi:HD-like signal output (HDOD) protein
MMRILFVDDEPRILEALRRMLHSQRREWQMVFANGGEAALQAFGDGGFDVVVTDMRMPGMDGAALLTEVRNRHPETIRLVLSGYTDRDAAARAAGVAHQFLMKPSSPDLLRDAIDRAVALRSQLSSARMRIVRALEKSDGAIDEVADVLCQDAALSAKLLQLVNSSFFGSARRVSSIHMAVQLLGLNMVKHLVLSLEVFRTVRDDEVEAAACIEALDLHARCVARTASAVFGGTMDRDELYAVGLLHDIGKLVLATQLPEEWRAVRAITEARGVPCHVAEEEVLGITHAQLGAYLLELWHLPVPLVEAVAFHHDPGRSPGGGTRLLTAVHVADALVHAGRGGDAAWEARLDTAYAARLGIDGMLPEWRLRAANLCGGEGE